jgi:cell division protein FtsB
VAGDRPYLAALVALLAIAVLMLAGPVSRHLDSRDRISTLEEQREVLGTEIERLESRVEDLHDPAHIELLAREQLGLVRPGEVPYVVVVPEQERPQVAPGSAPVVDARPWHRRLLDALGDVFR